MRIAVITGASSGLGEEFARQIAQTRGAEELDELWLIARRADRLQQVADSLPVACRNFALDLVSTDSLATLSAAFADQKVDIRYLVNSAGYGTQGPFATIDPDKITACLELNNWALVQLTQLAKPYMRAGAQVFQISSVSAFLPQPNYAVYAASKAFVLSFSQALHAEWQADQINVLAVCPNLMATDFIRRAEMPEDTLKVKQLGLEQAERVVRNALRAAAKGRAVAVSSWPGRFLRLVGKILPNNFVLWLEKCLGMY